MRRGREVPGALLTLVNHVVSENDLGAAVDRS